MKRTLAVILAALLLFGGAMAEEEGFGEPEDFGFEFVDDGYEGEWVEVEALSIEFCLPAGWKQTEAADGVAYAAENTDQTASLGIQLVAEGVEDLTAWGEENLKTYEKDEANFYDVLVVEGEEALGIGVIISGGRLIVFDFHRTSPDAITRSLALKIVGSACDIWTDDDVPLPEDGGDDGFSFGEAFEEDMG